MPMFFGLFLKNAFYFLVCGLFSGRPGRQKCIWPELSFLSDLKWPLKVSYCFQGQRTVSRNCWTFLAKKNTKKEFWTDNNFRFYRSNNFVWIYCAHPVCLNSFKKLSPMLSMVTFLLIGISACQYFWKVKMSVFVWFRQFDHFRIREQIWV